MSASTAALNAAELLEGRSAMKAHGGLTLVSDDGQFVRNNRAVEQPSGKLGADYCKTIETTREVAEELKKY